MTILFPRLGSPELEPFVQPFGRMMLAFGRASTAVLALAERDHGSEPEAVKFVWDTKTHRLPEKMGERLRGKLDECRFKQLDAALNRFKDLAAKRNHLAHGEWWFNIIENGQLEVRNFFGGKSEHLFDVSPDGLEQWAIELDEIAEDLEDIDYALRQWQQSEMS